MLLNEAGRSMVEILGVLAIIGVLSIAGIYGYKNAISQHKANETAYAVSLVAVEMEAASLMGGQEKVVLDLPKNSGVALKDYQTYKNAAIKVDFKDDALACKNFVQMYQNNPQFKVVAKCEE